MREQKIKGGEQKKSFVRYVVYTLFVLFSIVINIISYTIV